MFDKEMLLEIGSELFDKFVEKMGGGSYPTYPDGLSPETMALVKQDMDVRQLSNDPLYPTRAETAAMLNTAQGLNNGVQQGMQRFVESLPYVAKIEADYEAAVRNNDFGLAGGIAASNPSVITVNKMAEVAQRVTQLKPQPYFDIQGQTNDGMAGFGFSTEALRGIFESEHAGKGLGAGNPLSQNNLSTYIFHNFPVEQPQLFGLYPPAPIFHPDQDSQLPFFYNPVEDSYLGFRWDHGDVGPIIPPLTKDMIGRYSGLYLSTHPHHYHAPWLDAPHRLTEVYFKRPKVLMTTSEKQFHSWFKMTDPKDTGCPGILELHPSLKWYTDQGYNALMHTEIGDLGPEIILLNPVQQVVGVKWKEGDGNNPAMPIQPGFWIQQDHTTRTVTYPNGTRATTF